MIKAEKPCCNQKEIDLEITGNHYHEYEKPEPLKGKEQTIYGHDYEPTSDGGNVGQRTFYFKDDVRSAVEWLENKLKNELEFRKTEKCPGCECAEPIIGLALALIREAFPDVVDL